MHNHFLWATKRLTVMLNKMPEELSNQKSNLKNRSIREIVLHLVSIYAYFSSQPDYKIIVEQGQAMNKNDLLSLMNALSKKVFNILETNPDKTIPVKTKNGNIKNISGYSLFHMLTDHFAYHRGQLVTMFKGITGMEAVGTDYASFLTEDNPDIDL